MGSLLKQGGLRGYVQVLFAWCVVATGSWAVEINNKKQRCQCVGQFMAQYGQY